MEHLDDIKADILASAIAEVKHAFMIWENPPESAIAKAVLMSASKLLLENINDLVQPDDLPEDSFRSACRMLDQTNKKTTKITNQNKIDPDNDNIYTRPN